LVTAGVLYAKEALNFAKGDPKIAGAYYYGGPGGASKALKGVAVSDPVNKGFPNTLEYGDKVVKRMQDMFGSKPTVTKVNGVEVGKPVVTDSNYQELLAKTLQNYENEKLNKSFDYQSYVPSSIPVATKDEYVHPLWESFTQPFNNWFK
jgi:hypothetical protein